MKPRMLKKDEILIRTGQIYDNGITLLLYCSTHTVIKLLNSTFGELNWQRRHIKYDDMVLCELSVKNPETGEWIVRTDVGSPAFAEPTKSSVSDSLKRAARSYLVAEELATCRNIWVPIEKVNVIDQGGKRKVKDIFSVQSIEYDEEEREITGLVIVNQKQEVVYQYFETNKPKSENLRRRITSDQVNQLIYELNRTGTSIAAVLKKYKLKKLDDMDYDLWVKAMDTMKNVPDMAA